MQRGHKPTKGREKRMCKICKKRGHLWADCYQTKWKEQRRKYGDNYQAKVLLTHSMDSEDYSMFREHNVSNSRETTPERKLIDFLQDETRDTAVNNSKKKTK